jgi:hypothetical protein
MAARRRVAQTLLPVNIPLRAERNSTERNSTERNSTPDGTESGAELGVRGRHGQCFATAPCRQPALARERQDERCAPVALQSTSAFTLEDAVAFASNESH